MRFTEKFPPVIRKWYKPLLPSEKLVFLTEAPDSVPLGWISLLEQEVLPPLRLGNWQELEEAGPIDLVFVFPDQYENGRPVDPSIRNSQPVANWVAVIEKPDAAKVRLAIRAGYSEVVDLDSVAALIIGPVLKLREKRIVSTQEHKLLEESLDAYQQLSYLDRLRESLRVLDLHELALRVVRELADVVGCQEGSFWVPDDDSKTTGVLKAIHAEGSKLIGGLEKLALHAVPGTSELVQGKIIQREWNGVSTLFVPFVESDMLLALVQIPRLDSGGSSNVLLKREEGRLRMLQDWLKIALQNSLEADQMRQILKSRFGDFFSADSFRQHVEKGLLQASRYRRPMTLISLDHSGSASIRKRVFQYILELLRDADVFEETSDYGGRILLPETTYLGGVQFLRRIQRELSQKFQPGTGRDLLASIASYPWHGSDIDSLYAHLDRSMESVRSSAVRLGDIQQERAHKLMDVLAEHPSSKSLTDPNLWADLAFHLVQETTTIEPDSTRMLLFLGAYEDSVRTFSQLFDFPARWDRILVSAAIEGEQKVEPGPMNIIRDPAMLNTFMALLERPSGAVALWVNTRTSKGGLCRDVQLVRGVFNRFEDQYLLHHKWVQ